MIFLKYSGSSTHLFPENEPFFIIPMSKLWSTDGLDKTKGIDVLKNDTI